MTQWRKNRFAITISAALTFFGYTLVMPFLFGESEHPDHAGSQRDIRFSEMRI